MRRDKSIYTILGRTLSIVLHPMLMPLYAAIYLAGTSPLMRLLSISSRAYIVGLVAVDVVLLPAFYIWMMLHLKVIKDNSLSRPSDRIRPLVVLALCYALGLWGFRDMHTTFMISRLLWAGLLCTVTAAAVTPFWKISLHMMSQGAAVALLTLLCISGMCSVWLYCVSIAVAGCVASARLYLGAHNPQQAAAGFAAGAVLCCCSLLCF